MQSHHVPIAFTAFLCLASVGILGVQACGASKAPPPSAAELIELARSPRGAEALTTASAAHDAQRVLTALAASTLCPASNRPCQLRARADALESAEAAGEALRFAVAAQREAAGPAGPFALGPDDAAVYARLGVAKGPDGLTWASP